MVALPTDRIPIRGMVIGVLVLLSGTVTAALVENELLPALVATLVLLLLLVVDDRTREEE